MEPTKPTSSWQTEICVSYRRMEVQLAKLLLGEVYRNPFVSVCCLIKRMKILLEKAMYVSYSGYFPPFMETECLLQSSQELTTFSHSHLWKVPTKKHGWHLVMIPQLAMYLCWLTKISIKIVKFTDSVWFVDTRKILGLLSPFYMIWRWSWLTWWCVGCGRYRFGGVVP